MKSSHVPHKSLTQIHATFTPEAAQAVSRFPLNLSWTHNRNPVLTSSIIFRRLIEWFACAHLSESHLPRSYAVTFPKRSPPWLLTTAALGGLKPAPANRLRGARPHLLCSYAHFMTSALVAHYYENISVFKKPVISSKFRPKFDGFAAWNFYPPTLKTILSRLQISQNPQKIRRANPVK